MHKNVYIACFQGDQLKSRVKKISEGFRVTVYPCPETQVERREMKTGFLTRIEDLNTVGAAAGAGAGNGNRWGRGAVGTWVSGCKEMGKGLRMVVGNRLQQGVMCFLRKKVIKRPLTPNYNYPSSKSHPCRRLLPHPLTDFAV